MRILRRSVQHKKNYRTLELVNLSKVRQGFFALHAKRWDTLDPTRASCPVLAPHRHSIDGPPSLRWHGCVCAEKAHIHRMQVRYLHQGQRRPWVPWHVATLNSKSSSARSLSVLSKVWPSSPQISWIQMLRMLWRSEGSRIAWLKGGFVTVGPPILTINWQQLRACG